MNSHEERVLTDCSMCHDQCVSSCPVFAVDRRTTTYPGRKVYLARCLSKDEIEYCEDVTHAIYQCCGCRLCSRNCVYEPKGDARDPNVAYHKARYDLIRMGVKPDYVRSAEDAVARHGHLYGDVGQAYGEVKLLANAEDKCDLIFLADAETLAYNPESVVASLKLLGRKNIRVKLSEEIETGYDLQALGFFDQAVASAKKMADYLAGIREEKIVVGSPKAYFALTQWYKELNIEIEKELFLETDFLFDLFIVHFSQYKSRYRDINNFLKMDKLGIYHDGSFMARYLKNHETPRLLVKPLFRYFDEFRTCKEDAKPVAPAVYPLGIPEATIQGIAARRIEEIEEKNPDFVVTSEAASYRALKKYWRKDRVMSIPEALLLNHVEMKDF